MKPHLAVITQFFTTNLQCYVKSWMHIYDRLCTLLQTFQMLKGLLLQCTVGNVQAIKEMGSEHFMHAKSVIIFCATHSRIWL